VPGQPLYTQTLYTGMLEGKVRQTSGRATIYKTADGKEYLRLTDFSTLNAADVHILLVHSDDESLKPGVLKGSWTALNSGR
jgi:hypothetical protein